MNARKITGILLIAAAVIIIAVYVVGLAIPAGSTKETTSSHTASTDAATGDNETTVDSINDLVGPVEYDFHSEIANLIVPVSFDAAFTSFLEKNSLLVTANGSGNPVGILKVTDTGVIQKNLDEGSYYFDIRLYDQDSTIIGCTIDSTGNASFDLFQDSGGLI